MSSASVSPARLCSGRSTVRPSSAAAVCSCSCLSCLHCNLKCSLTSARLQGAQAADGRGTAGADRSPVAAGGTASTPDRDSSSRAGAAGSQPGLAGVLSHPALLCCAAGAVVHGILHTGCQLWHVSRAAASRQAHTPAVQRIGGAPAPAVFQKAGRQRWSLMPDELGLWSQASLAAAQEQLDRATADTSVPRATAGMPLPHTASSRPQHDHAISCPSCHLQCDCCRTAAQSI